MPCRQPAPFSSRHMSALVVVLALAIAQPCVAQQSTASTIDMRWGCVGELYDVRSQM